VSDIAHLGPVELFTPAGDESLRFFVDVMGMEVEHTDGAATYLRGWGDYQPWSLKLIASDTSGMGVLGLRAASREALARIAQGFFLYGLEPGGNRIEVTTSGRFVYAPDEPCVVWTEAERAKGQAWGVQTVPSFHSYGTPPVT